MRALDAYVVGHLTDELTALANAMADDIDDEMGLFRQAGARNALRHTEW